MKKIIAWVLLLCCFVSLVSCNKGTSGDLATLTTMFENSPPTRIVIQTTQDFSGNKLHNTQEFVQGTLESGKAAAVYKYTFETLASPEDQLATPVKTDSGIREYVYGMGVREDGGKWNPGGVNFSPAKGAFALTLDPTAISNYTYQNRILSFTLKAADASKVLGSAFAIPVDAEVTVVNDGAYINKVEISYTAPATADFPEGIKTVLTASYEYDTQVITLYKK